MITNSRVARLRRTARCAAFSSLTLVLLSALPLAAQQEDDDDNTWQGSALRVFDCDEGEDCARIFQLGGSGGFLGVSAEQLTPELRAHFGAPRDAGVLIGRVVEGTPAGEAGMLVGDVVVAIDGEAVTSPSRLGRMIRSRDDGAAADIEVIRERRSLVLRATIAHRERTTVELSDFIGDSVLGTLESLDLESIGKSIGTLDWGSFGTFDAAGLEEAMEAIGKAFDSDAWKDYMERIESMDFSQLEERMEELQERMRELERELQERFEERDD